MDALRYIIVTDYDFPLRTDLLKPYPFHNFLFPHRLFNYRLSRGRRIFENGFGILANRFRFFFLSGFSFTNIHESQDCRGRGHLFNSSLPLPLLHRHLDISRAITAESSPLRISCSRNRTGNLWFPSASR